MRVLVVEDEPQIAKDIIGGLKAAGYVAEHSADGEDGWFRGDTETFDAIVLDIGLPLVDGLTVLRRWRAVGRPFPVLLLTARDDWRDKVEGIDAGADDYLAKPFRMEELLARIRAITRRAVGQSSPILSNGHIEVDTRQRCVTLAGEPVSLTPLEYRLLSYLMHHQGRVVSQTEISDHIHGQEIERDSNAMEALVSRLRRKLGSDVIETRRGHGYVVPVKLQHEGE